MKKCNIPELKKQRIIYVLNDFHELFTINLFSVYKKMNHNTKRCETVYDGSWQYNNESAHNVYAQSMIELKQFINKNDVVSIRFENK
jgi:hypothetical protein